MQYILTQQEFDDLKATQALDLRLKKEALQELCTKIADTMPINRDWCHKEPASPWRCIITVSKEGKNHWYCDDCPVREICPKDYKSWSK